MREYQLITDATADVSPEVLKEIYLERDRISCISAFHRDFLQLTRMPVPVQMN